jgi:hypothetical protein
LLTKNIFGSFVKMIASLLSEEDYAALLDNYGVRRTSTEFWAQSDLLHDAYRAAAPDESSVFDFNQFENRCYF